MRNELINQRVLDTSLKVFMRFRVAGSSQDVIRVLERIEYVARALNIEVNGTSIVLTVKRGFFESWSRDGAHNVCNRL